MEQKKLKIIYKSRRDVKIYTPEGEDITNYFSGFEIKASCDENARVTLFSPCVEFECEGIEIEKIVIQDKRTLNEKVREITPLGSIEREYEAIQK